MTSVESFTTRFYRLKCRHVPFGMYLKWLGSPEDIKCWWCGRRRLQTWEHLICQCSRWKVQQTELWKSLGKATGWKVSRCRHVQISGLFTLEGCEQGVMDFLAATEIWKFPPKLAVEPGQKDQGKGQWYLDRGQPVCRFVDLSGVCFFPCISFFLSNHVH
jgi:hypothetical protein